MKQVIDYQNWSRREYFEWFGRRNNPYFGVTAEVDVTSIHTRAKAAGESFYFRYLHAILRVVNGIKQFRYRLEGDRIVLFDRIHLSPTVPHRDGSFGFGFFEYDPDYAVFAAKAQADTERVQAGSGLMPHPDHIGRIDTIYSTAIPWVSFTSFTHARDWGHSAGIVLLATGKVLEREGRLRMPVQVESHHGFADGRHMGLLFERIQQYMDEEPGI